MEALFPGETSGIAVIRVRYIGAFDDPSELIVADWWEECPVRRRAVVELAVRNDGLSLLSPISLNYRLYSLVNKIIRNTVDQSKLPLAKSKVSHTDADGTRWFETPIVGTRVHLFKLKDGCKKYPRLTPPPSQPMTDASPLDAALRMFVDSAGGERGVCRCANPLRTNASTTRSRTGKVDLDATVPPHLRKGIPALKAALERSEVKLSSFFADLIGMLGAGDIAGADWIRARKSQSVDGMLNDSSTIPRCVIYSDMVVDHDEWTGIYVGKTPWLVERAVEHLQQLLVAEACGPAYATQH